MLSDLLNVELYYQMPTPVYPDELVRRFGNAALKCALESGDLVVHNIAPAQALSCHRRPFVSLSEQGRTKARRELELNNASMAAIRGGPDLLLS
jgi:hypothetical protein